MKNKFQSKAVPRGTRTIWRYLGALFLIFTLSIGQMWGATFTEKWQNGKNESTKDLIATFTLGTNASYGSSKIQIASGKTGSFTWAVPTGYTITSVKFLMNTSDDYVKTFAAANGTVTKTATKEWTYEPSATNISSETFSLQAQSSAVKIEKVHVTFTDGVSDANYESLYPVSAGSETPKVVTFTSSAATSNVTSLTTENGVNNQCVQVANGKKVVITTSKNIKYILFSWNKYAPSKDSEWTASTGSYAKASYKWTPANTTTKSVEFTRGASNTAEISNIHIVYYADAPAASYTVTLNPNEGGYASTPDGWTADGSNIKKTVSAGALTIPEPTRATYTFNGWKSGVTAVTLTDGKLTVAKDTTLVAQWLAPCAATAPGDITKGALTAGEITLTAGGSAAEGDTWYWQDAADGTATDKGTGASKTVDAAGTYYVRSYNADGDCWSVAKSITLEAEDFIAHYAITYNPGTGGSGSIAAGDKTQDVAFTLSSEMFTRTGYVQVGWATTDGGTKAYDLGGSYTDNKAQEFFPVWAEKDTYAAAFACSASAPAGWTFSSDDGWADNKTIAAYVCKFTDNGVAAPGTNGMNENWVAFAKNTAAVATYDLGYATTISALNVTLYGGSSSAFNQKIEFVGADGTSVKKSYTNSLGAGNWAANSISKTDVVPNVRYIKVYGASKWVVMSAFSVTYGDLSTKYTVTYNLNGGTGTTPTQSALAAGKTFTLHDGTTDITAPTDKVFSNWKDQDDALFAGSAEYTMPAKNVTLTAQWVDASSTYSVTYNNGGHGTAPDAESAVSVVLDELSAEGWAHKGWTANVDVTVDAATIEAGTLIANGKTAILASNVTFTAVWKEIFTVTFDAKGGSAVDPVDVEDGATLAAAPEDPTKDNYIFQGWSETDGGSVVADITAITISDDKTFYAIWALDVQVSEIVFSNSFKGWIHDGQVEVFYMAGESALTIVSYDGKNLKAEGAVVISGDKVIATGTDDSEVEFDLTMTEVTPLTATGAQNFDGSEGYVKTRHPWTAERKWKMSKYATDGRVARGETSMYIFLGAAESVTLDWGAQKVTNDVAVYVNGTFVKNVGKNNNSAIELSNGNNMVALYSLQTSGDIWLNGLTVAPWVPVTAVTLKEGENEISAKEIWASTSFTLTAEVTPDNASNKTITWTSSDPTVATVADGVVTGVAANASPVTITASTVDGVTATCAVTVTAAPEPSAAPTISTQPASANYYEGATIAALEVVATGESLSYQWYLGADAISGAEAATYTPTVSAIGSYVYHCVVTNTEAGKLPTSLASSNATIAIAEDPAAIKLFDGEGNLNTTNFISPEKTTIEISEVEYTCLKEFSSNRTSLGGATPADMVKYDVTTDKAKIKMTFYNNNSGVKKAILYKYEEGGTPEKIEIEVPGQQIFTTEYYEFNSSKNRTFYVCMNDRSNIRVLQVKVIDNGANPVKQFGQVGYSLNLNKARFYAKNEVEKNFEGFTFTPSSEYKVYNNSNLATKSANSFTIASPTVMSVTRSGGKYYVYQDPEDKGTLYSSNAEIELNTTGTWYISSETSSSAASFTKIEFLAPKCEQPTITPMSNSDLCEGDDFAPLTVSATVSDEGTLHYAWFKEAGETDEAVGTDAASYTPEADGEYYVVVTNRLADHSDNSATSNTITVTHFASAVITSAPMNQRAEAGNAVTLTVAATGKNVAYKWYTCDEDGSNEVALDPAETGTSLNVTVTAGMNQWYKVIVTSDCGNAEAKAKVSEFQPTTPATVTESIVWDWTSSVWPASGTAAFTNEDAPDYELLADADAIVPNAEGFRSDMLYGKGQYVWRSGNKFFQGTAIKFTTTVAGAVRVYFRSTGGGKTVEVAINGTSAGSRTNSFGWSSYVEVPAGEVEMICTGDGYTRIQKIEFLALAHQRTTGYAAGDLGTVCLEDATIIDGATLYELQGLDEHGYLAFDEILSGELEAGKPYLFQVTNPSKISFYKPVGAAHSDDEIANKGMIGTFSGTTLTQGVDDLCYFSGRHIWRVNDFTVGIPIPAHRCYVNYDTLKGAGPASAPAAGRRRVIMGVNGKDEAQGFENLDASETPMKVMIDGTLYILRGEKVFDATGRLVK